MNRRPRSSFVKNLLLTLLSIYAFVADLCWGRRCSTNINKHGIVDKNNKSGSLVHSISPGLSKANITGVFFSLLIILKLTNNTMSFNGSEMFSSHVNDLYKWNDAHILILLICCFPSSRVPMFIFSQFLP